MTDKFNQMNKKFNQMTDKFNQMNKKFNQMTDKFNQMDKKFNQMNKKFNSEWLEKFNSELQRMYILHGQGKLTTSDMADKLIEIATASTVHTKRRRSEPLSESVVPTKRRRSERLAELEADVHTKRRRSERSGNC